MPAVSKLPPRVPIRDGALPYSATNRDNVRAFAEHLLAFREHRRGWVLAASIADMRVMVAPWYLRLAVWIGAKRNRCLPLQVWMSIFARKPEIARDLIERTAVHAVQGKDHEDPRSVGGFSQRELNFIGGCMAQIEEMN